MIRWTIGAVTRAAGVVLVFLVIPGGGISLIAFEVLLIVIAVATIRRAAPPNLEVDGPAARRFPRNRKLLGYPALPQSLRRVERLVRYSGTHAYAARTRLVPLLRQLADDALKAHHRFDIRSDPDRARDVLGADAWRIVGPDWEAITDPPGPGPSLAEIEAVVAALEQMEVSR